MAPLPCPSAAATTDGPADVMAAAATTTKTLTEEESSTMTTNETDTRAPETRRWSSPEALAEEARGDKTPTLDFRNAKEWFSFFCGAVFLVCTGPAVGIVVFAAMIWEALDRGFAGGFVDSGKELTGFIFAKFIPWLERSTHQFNAQFVKRPQDAYMMNCIYGYGIIVPAMFFGCAWYSYYYGSEDNIGGRYMTPLWMAFVYHLIRIGPYFMNFAYVYTLCHKEGHSRTGLFSKRYNNSVMLRNVFNWWIGMFYGVLPATFAYGHSINHHRYNNNEFDVISTVDKPRDNFFNWVAYLPRFILYAINISTIRQFAMEESWKVVQKVIFGSVWFLVWLSAWAILWSPTFALVFIAFPFFEQSILLAAINWSWHAFIDPVDPSNEYVQSITILDGCINVLNEDAHVVHHKVPGAHWTDHPAQQTKYWEQYIVHRASCFRRTHAFEIFGMSVAQDYDALATKFVDLKGVANPTLHLLTHDEKVRLIKERLRGCWWGPRVVRTATGEEKKEQ